MKAYLKNYNQSPRKVRLIAGLVRGMDASKAQIVLKFMDKKSAPIVRKLIASAVANAEAQGKKKEDLIVKEIFVDQGISLRRWRPKAFGRATPFRRNSSKVTLQLGEKTANIKTNK